MGLMAGSASFIELTVPRDVLFNPSQVTPHTFRDIDDNLDTGSAGWVSPLDQFDTSRPILALGDYVVLAMRIDERKVPGAVLKRMVAKEERRVRIEQQVPRLSRGMRREIKERIHTELIRTARPVTTVVEVVWNVVDGRILFFSTSGGALEIFESLFKETFGIVPQTVLPEHTDSFLAWCWWQSSVVELNGRMTLGDGPEQQVTAAPGPEAFKALALGKHVRQAAVRVADRGTCVFAPGTMTYRSVKVPRGAGGETDDGAILDRIGLFVALVDAVGRELERYIDQRTDVQTDLLKWIMEAR